LPGILFLLIGLITLVQTVPHADLSYSGPGPDDLTIIIFGAAFVVIGILTTTLTFVRLRRRASMATNVLETGIDTEGTITFVDRNYGVKVSGRYIYSIIEYKFTDLSNKEYVKKVTEASTEEVIRCKIEVGGTVKVKYLPNDPTQSIIMLNTGGIVA
jgi:Na+/melibiose symporter-like transporter